MKFSETTLSGVWLIEAEPSSDARGSFARLYCPREFAEAGIDFTPAQVNLSRNLSAQTLRGMHYQQAPRAETKLVQVSRGAIYDVVIDLRTKSSTCHQWVGVHLDATSLSALFIPEGCAHGFLTLEADTDVLYHMSPMFESGWDRGVRWNDPAFGIDWPAEPQVLSDRDAGYTDFGA